MSLEPVKPRRKRVQPPRVVSFMPRIFLSIDKDGARMYKGKQKHSSYTKGKDGKYSSCLVMALAAFRTVRKQEERKALVRFNHSKTLPPVKVPKRSLDEVFGKPVGCDMFDLSDIRDEVKRLEKENSKDKV